ncbi:MAG: universal stress protein [Candidatus Methanofastidiosum sp.]|nr:universal stress protein [Methanofastidiosum sp.]
MFKRIFLIVDVGLEVRIVAMYATLISKCSNASLFLVPYTDNKGVLENIDFIKKITKEEGLEAEILDIKGDILYELNKIIRDKDLDLVITPLKRQENGLFFIGSFSQRLMKYALSSVIGIRIVKARPLKQHKKLLVPLYDKDYYPKERIFLIEALSKSLDLNVSVLRCIKNPNEKMDKEEMQKAFTETQNYYSPFINKLKENGIHTDLIIRECEHATDGILDETMASNYDLLFVKAKAQNTLKEFLMGNEVEDILRRTPSNLLFWRSRE